MLKHSENEKIIKIKILQFSLSINNNNNKFIFASNSMEISTTILCFFFYWKSHIEKLKKIRKFVVLPINFVLKFPLIALKVINKSYKI